MDNPSTTPQDSAGQPVDPWAEPDTAGHAIHGSPVIVDRPSLWQRMGGGSLSISVVLHTVLILLALVWYISSSVTPPPEQVDFLPGGGGGGKGTAEKLAIKKRQAVSMATPKVRIASTATSSIALPDIQTSISTLSALSQNTTMGGGLGGGSDGLNGSGSGGMRGNGRGTGMGPGSGAGFVSVPMIFGNKIDAKRLAVVLDMSGSMYAFMPLVIKEVDKVAAGSTIVLHYGCGLGAEEDNRIRIEETAGGDFEKSRIYVNLKESQTVGMTTDERSKLLDMVKKRAKTYFVPSDTVSTTWAALMAERLKDVDAVYWFSDFADPITDERIKDVARKLKARRQKLYIQPSNPEWRIAGNAMAANVAKLKEEIVDPSGGKVIDVDLKKQSEEAKSDQKPGDSSMK
ncbi:MAG: hypothetical protein JWM59_2643 [Verrucomicrobiales bacterium]|nr:hypothetical protein [Verrucomicrobiales bacterium]